MSEKLNQYQQEGYDTFNAVVYGLKWWADNEFGGDLDKALEFALADIDDLETSEHIVGIREAHRWLKDHSSS